LTLSLSPPLYPSGFQPGEIIRGKISIHSPSRQYTQFNLKFTGSNTKFDAVIAVTETHVFTKRELVLTPADIDQDKGEIYFEIPIPEKRDCLCHSLSKSEGWHMPSMKPVKIFRDRDSKGKGKGKGKVCLGFVTTQYELELKASRKSWWNGNGDR
jgi:hypothetical protein